MSHSCLAVRRGNSYRLVLGAVLEQVAEGVELVVLDVLAAVVEVLVAAMAPSPV
jgi:hypothetical protein